MNRLGPLNSGPFFVPYIRCFGVVLFFLFFFVFFGVLFRFVFEFVFVYPFFCRGSGFVHKGNKKGSRYFGKKKQIIALQDSYAEAMEVFGLVCGESKEQTGANHQSLNEWHKQEDERLLAEIVKIEKEKVVIEQGKNRVFADDRAVPTKSRVIGDELFDILE